MIQKRKQATIRITHKRYTQHNRQHTDKLYAEVLPDSISVWCRYCDKAHLVSKEKCMKFWEANDALQLTIWCNKKSHANGPNARGVNKAIAYLYHDGILLWCKHCQNIHKLTKDRCLKAWEELRVQEQETATKRRTTLD